MADNGPSIGNYKGVMLCNRPFAGVSAAAKKAYNNGRKAGAPPFLSTCQNSEPLGLNPIRHPPNVVVDRSKKHTALSKHLRFLRELQKQKKSVEEELVEELREKEERRRRFRERRRIERERVVRERRGDEDGEDGHHGGNQDDGGGGDSGDNGGEPAEGKQAETGPAESKACEGKDAEDDETAAPRRVASKKQLEGKPRWALSAQAAEDLEDYEADELVEFAKSLDFDEFVNDLEVRSALEAAKERIMRLKEEQTAAEDGEETKSAGTAASARAFLDAAERKSKGEVAEEGGWDASTKVGRDSAEEKWETASIASARSILSSSSVKSLKQVHSARSLAKMAEKISKESAQALRRIEEDAGSEGVPPPRIVKIHEDDRTRLTNKTETYNLPYMHRNPAV